MFITLFIVAITKAFTYLWYVIVYLLIYSDILDMLRLGHELLVCILTFNIKA